MPAVLIGCGFGVLIIVILLIGGVILFNSSDFRGSFCAQWANNPRDAATPCPLAPSTP